MNITPTNQNNQLKTCRSNRPILIAILVISVLAMLFSIALFIWNVRPIDTESFKRKNISDDLVLSEPVIVDNDLFINITNASSTAMESISINFLCYDKQGKYLGCESIYEPYLPAGEKIRCSAYLYGSTEYTEAVELLDITAYEYEAN